MLHTTLSLHIKLTLIVRRFQFYCEAWRWLDSRLHIKLLMYSLVGSIAFYMIALYFMVLSLSLSLKFLPMRNFASNCTSAVLGKPFKMTSWERYYDKPNQWITRTRGCQFLQKCLWIFTNLPDLLCDSSSNHFQVGFLFRDIFPSAMTFTV